MNVTNGSGILLASELGVAGSFSATASVTLPAGVDIVATTFRIDVNTSAAAVSESLLINGDTLELSLPGGPFLQVAVIGASVFIGDEPSITADLFFRSASGDVFFGVRNFAVTIDGNVVGGGEGAFLVLATGIAGIASGSVSGSVGPVSGGASGTLRINTTNTHVQRSFTFDGQTFSLDLPQGTDGMFFDLAVTGASLNIGASSRSRSAPARSTAVCWPACGCSSVRARRSSRTAPPTLPPAGCCSRTPSASTSTSEPACSSTPRARSAS